MFYACVQKLMRWRKSEKNLKFGRGPIYTKTYINEDAAKTIRKRTILQTAEKGAMMCQVSEYSPASQWGA
jgi:hypothetical protein